MIFEFEVALMVWLQKLFGAAAVYIGTVFTYLGELVFLIAVIGFLYWCYDKELAKTLGVAIVAVLVWNPMVKNVVLRRRPYMDHAEIKCLKAPTTPTADICDLAAQGYSFPSGHSTNGACIYGYMPFRWKHVAFKVCAFVLPFLIGLSRVMLGVHYPTDVIFGWLMGYGIMLIVVLIQRLVKRQWIVNLIIFVISLAGIFYCRSEDYFSSLGVMAGLFLAIPFEDRFVKFENTRKPLQCVLRLVGGFAGFGLLDVLLKLPFPSDFLTSGTLPALLVRSARYFVIVFLLLGVYPLAFRFFEKVGRK